MESIVFKYGGKNPVESLMSEELFQKIKFLQTSRIDKFPMYEIDNTIDLNIRMINILNNRQFDELKIVLRKMKIERLINRTKKINDTKMEFLNFWYTNHENLYVMIPL